MTAVETIVQELQSVQSSKELSEIIAAVKLRQTFLARNNIRRLAVGSEVRFNARGRTVYGEVTKVNRKTVVVRESGTGFATSWRVPASLLEVV